MVLPALSLPDRDTLRASWRSWSSNDLQRKGPAWLQWFWTLLFCAGLAVGFTIMGFAFSRKGVNAWSDVAQWVAWFGRNFVVCLTIGVSIHTLHHLGYRFVLARSNPAGWKPWQRTAYFGGVPMLGVLLGWPLGMTFLGVDMVRWISGGQAGNVVVGSLLFSLLITFLMHHFFAARTREIEAERNATEAQLRLLQAQIEPHFLFNTLANVLSLMEHEPATAKAMLESFTTYLRASMGTMRRSESSLDDELALASAYLDVQQARMGPRLRVCIEASGEARRASLLPLVLQPLVENALHHGIEPQVEGGQISIRASVQGGALVVAVSDDGVGLGQSRRRGAGLALGNIRERLVARYGPSATLTLEVAQPGTRAVLRIPLIPGPATTPAQKQT